MGGGSRRIRAAAMVERRRGVGGKLPGVVGAEQKEAAGAAPQLGAEC